MSMSSEDVLINELGAIDLHHGLYSANPPYTVLEVIGTGITARLKAELWDFGFDDFQETDQGSVPWVQCPQNGEGTY